MAATVERFGAYTRLLEPGLQFVMPYVDRIGRKLNVQEQVVEIGRDIHGAKVVSPGRKIGANRCA